MRLIITIISMLAWALPTLSAEETKYVRSPLEPDLATALENGKFRVKRYHTTEVQNFIMDAEGKQKEIVVVSPDGVRTEPVTETVEVIGSSYWQDNSPDGYDFLDIQGKLIPQKDALSKFSKEAPAVYLNVSFEEVKPFLAPYKPDTIFIKSNLPIGRAVPRK